MVFVFAKKLKGPPLSNHRSIRKKKFAIGGKFSLGANFRYSENFVLHQLFSCRIKTKIKEPS